VISQTINLLQSSSFSSSAIFFVPEKVELRSDTKLASEKSKNEENKKICFFFHFFSTITSVFLLLFSSRRFFVGFLD
jgi:hypothetical protein